MKMEPLRASETQNGLVHDGYTAKLEKDQESEISSEMIRRMDE